jgi:hypothetical protein
MTTRSLFSLGWCAALVCLAGPAAGFEVNGRHWDQLPVTYFLNPQGCPVLDGGETIGEIAAAAAANWSQVPCSAMRIELVGQTEATFGPDGQNTIFCVDQDWAFSPGAAGAAVWIQTPPGEPLEVDLALNAADFSWRLGGGNARQADVIDPVAVLTHELGHWVGLAHSPDPYATMYFASLPNGIGADLTADDMAGVCSLYPSGQAMCALDEDCPAGHRCIQIAGIPVCQEPHDGPGAFCDKDFINCDGMCWVNFFECTQICLFTRLDYSDGYCAPLCNEVACPEGFECQYLPDYDVSVCFLDPAQPDGGTDGDGGLDADGAPDGQADADAGESDDEVDGGGDEADAGSDPRADPESPDAGEQADMGQSTTDTESGPGGCGCRASGAAGGRLWLGFGLVGLLFAGIRRRAPRGCARRASGPADARPRGGSAGSGRARPCACRAGWRRAPRR